MKKRSRILAISLGCLLLLASSGFGQRQKLAQTGMKFLSVSTDARLSALAQAGTAVYSNSAAMFYNPSGMATQESMTEVMLGQVSWIADIKYAYGSAAFSPANGQYGVFGVNFVSVDYGDFYGTILADNPLGYEDVGIYSPTAFAAGLGYAIALSDKFSVGGVLKYVFQDLGSGIVGFDEGGETVTKGFEENVVAYDFGILYRTGFRSLNFGMAIRNFSREVKYEEEGFQLPLTFNIGLSMDMTDFYDLGEGHDFLLSVDASHPRDFEEQLAFGAEYVFMNSFAIRGGYQFPNDEHGFAAGAGFNQSLAGVSFALDYAYSPWDVFEDVHRFTFRFGF